MSVDELVEKGKIMLRDGRFDEALSNFEQALLLDPSNTEILNQKGSTLRSLGRYDEALECFNKSLSIDPADKDAS